MKYLYFLILLLIVYLCYKSYANKEEHFESVSSDIKNNVFKGLKIVDTILDKHNIWYVAAYGTLLGGVRHWGMIPWDDDGDLLILRKDVDKIMSLKDEFEKYGCTLVKDWKLIKVYMNEKKYPFIDLFINEDENGKFLRCMEPYDKKCSYPDKNMKEHEWWWKWVGYPSEWVMERKKIKFDNFEIWAPIKAVDLLQFWYGKDVLVTCKTPELDHITGDPIAPASQKCKGLPSPQI